MSSVSGLAISCVLALAWVTPVEGVTSPCPADAELAVVNSVRAVFGEEAEVTLTDLHCDGTSEATRVARAVPEPGSRTGGPVRFVLYADAGTPALRAGRMTAVVDVAAPHARTIAAQPANAVLDAHAVTHAHGSVGRVVFGALPLRDAITGRRLRRALAADTVLTHAAIEREMLVRSGRDVVTVARVEGLEVRGRAVAVQSGDIGEVVLVVNPDSRKRLRGRVVGPATVEVLHVS